MRLGVFRCAATAVLFAMASQPAQACWNTKSVNAAKVMNFKNMLMVNALRCRFGDDKYINDYNRFVKNNRSLLASQNNAAKQHFVSRYGSRRAVNELDRFNVSLANTYGAGHPTMDCAELKKLTQEIAGRQNLISLVKFADDTTKLPSLPGGQCKTRVASRK